ncbi:MAG: ABC transporter ATP-binding protein [Oscillospiraceae bacterium]
MIEVKNLVKEYGSKRAVDGISFTVNDGEILGFLGPNGAGKSTTMNMITGYLSATSGTVVIDGADILDEPVRAKKNIGYLPEVPPLYPDMTVDEYLSFVFDLKKVPLPKKEHIAEVCDLVKISEVRGRVIKHLSKGYKQRVGMAQALLGNPEVLILDEPTVGLDPKQITEIRSLIKDLGKKRTVILSSHILPEVQAVCERVIVINKGRLVADGSPEELSRSLSGEHRLTLRIEGEESAVLKALSEIPGAEKVVPLGEKEPSCFDFEVEAKDGADLRRKICKSVFEHGWLLLEMRSSAPSLEEVFLRLTGDGAEETKGSESE